MTEMTEEALAKIDMEIMEKRKQLQKLTQEIMELEALRDINYSCGGNRCHRCTQFPNYPPPQVS